MTYFFSLFNRNDLKILLWMIASKYLDYAMKSSSQNQRDNETTVKKICIFVWHIYSNKCMYNYRDCTAGVYRITNQFQTQYRSWWNTPTNVCNSSPGFFSFGLFLDCKKVLLSIKSVPNSRSPFSKSANNWTFYSSLAKWFGYFIFTFMYFDREYIDSFSFFFCCRFFWHLSIHCPYQSMFILNFFSVVLYLFALLYVCYLDTGKCTAEKQNEANSSNQTFTYIDSDESINCMPMFASAEHWRTRTFGTRCNPFCIK